MSNDTVFRRRISPTERLYFSTRDLAPPFLMQLVVHGNGGLDPAELRRAVTVASAANPGSRLVRDGDDWVDSGTAAAVRVVAGASLNYPALEDDPILNSPIGPTPERTCEVLLLTGDPVTIVFRVFHGVMDGMGVRMWVSDIFRVLQGQEPLGAADPIADADIVARIGAPGKPTLVLPVYPSAAGCGRQDRAASHWLLRNRTIPVTGKGTVARVAAILAAQAETKCRIMIPVDLRRHAPEIRTTANLALPLFIDMRPGDDWRGINADKRSGLQANRELNQLDNGGLAKLPPFVVRGILRAANWLGARLDLNIVSATVSYMGRFELDEVSAPGFTATAVRGLPQHTGIMPLLFGIVEYDGQTDITVSCRNGEGVEARLESLLDRIASTLEHDLSNATL
ncbi:peptide synthetase [Nocardia sp. NBC_00565]|uniref:peptide synthetase n=1 Tax=Nocardia sp. NBC_00565 TaxID=2975993 RepID=UPI002E8151FC|nr:peptide synthetase [Nocardia sp. NBC_00565]WUC05327.1 peptide synthetase [Nocardia sp. NBC_00565]